MAIHEITVNQTLERIAKKSSNSLLERMQTLKKKLHCHEHKLRFSAEIQAESKKKTKKTHHSYISNGHIYFNQCHYQSRRFRVPSQRPNLRDQLLQRYHKDLVSLGEKIWNQWINSSWLEFNPLSRWPVGARGT